TITSPGKPPVFAIFASTQPSTRQLATANLGRCTSASWVGSDVLVTYDDCEGNARGVLYDQRGEPRGALGGATAIDTTAAYAVKGASESAIVVPRAYALVLTDLPAVTHQTIIDLVSIQAASSSNPTFAVTALSNGEWLVASPTGGVGVIEPGAASVAPTWIIPRCEARE